nr:hypothetical protein [Chromatium okenii]
MGIQRKIASAACLLTLSVSTLLVWLIRSASGVWRLGRRATSTRCANGVTWRHGGCVQEVTLAAQLPGRVTFIAGREVIL